MDMGPRPTEVVYKASADEIKKMGGHVVRRRSQPQIGGNPKQRPRAYQLPLLPTIFLHQSQPRTKWDGAARSNRAVFFFRFECGGSWRWRCFQKANYRLELFISRSYKKKLLLEGAGWYVFRTRFREPTSTVCFEIIVICDIFLTWWGMPVFYHHCRCCNFTSSKLWTGLAGWVNGHAKDSPRLPCINSEIESISGRA